MSTTDPKLRGNGGPSGPGPSWRVEGLPNSEESEKPAGPQPPRIPRAGFLALLLGLFVVNWFLYLSLSPTSTDRFRVSYTTFRQEVVSNNVKEIVSRGDVIQGEFKAKVSTLDAEKPVIQFETLKPGFARDDDLLTTLVANKVPVNARSTEQSLPIWQRLLFGFGPALLIVGLMFFMLRKMSPTMAGLGRSKAKLVDASVKRTTFEDVAGIDDAEEELVEIVDFLRNPDRYRRLGATIPKGVLLSGPPGTGKTLLARAVAGEAGVPFFSLSASEFVEMIVGVGASRVRDLFETAKKAAPAIIFIDELDAIGRSRSSVANAGGHDEREQTLNQILTEMDGFTGSEGVIVLAATNRPEILDSALLRPGRFDRRVVVGPPDLAGRRAILEVHTRNVPLGADVNLEGIASTTPGFVGAELKNLVNEGAIMAVRRNHEQVRQADLADAFEKVVLGTARNIVISIEEKTRTAYHESGHALIGMLSPGADPVRKVSIIPRGRALGVTFQAPDNDRYDYDAEYLKGRIRGLLGGRAAEEVVYGTVTTGAESDLEQVTSIARRMVGRWGMSAAIGPIAVLSSSNDDSMNFPGVDPISSETRALVDAEVRRIVEDCYADVLSMLGEHRRQLDNLVSALLERETLDEVDIYAAVGIERTRQSKNGNSSPMASAQPTHR